MIENTEIKGTVAAKTPCNPNNLASKCRTKTKKDTGAVLGKQEMVDYLFCNDTEEANKLYLDGYDSAEDSGNSNIKPPNTGEFRATKLKNSGVKALPDISFEKQLSNSNLKELTDKKTRCKTELDLAALDDSFKDSPDGNALGQDSDVDEPEKELLLSKDSDTILKENRLSCLAPDSSVTPRKLSTKEYKSRVATIKELNIKDIRNFVLSPPPKNRIVQVTIFRDRAGLKGRFYPKYHVVFSVY